MSFLICCRLYLCREIIKSKLTKHPERYQAFHMSLYCFPNPTDPAQVRWFELYNPNIDGMRENELAKLMVQMDDWEKLTTVRTSLKDGYLKYHKGYILFAMNLL